MSIKINYRQLVYSCQACKGMGTPEADAVYNRWCYWCLGSGEVDGPTRARWLNYRKQIKRINKKE